MNLSMNAKDQIQVNFIDKINQKKAFINNTINVVNKYNTLKAA
jgi:hypothetical protein